MNSCAYVCDLRHDRPGKNRFRYNIYLYYLDLDELKTLSERFTFFGHNAFNLVSFHDEDHFLFVRQKGKADVIARDTFKYTRERYAGKDTKERVREAIKELGLGFDLGKVYLLTNLRNLGYIFNPVSFYYCYDKKGTFRALLSEVNNTYRDQKLYHMKIDQGKKEFNDIQKKNFYISPFIDHDTEISWRFKEPGELLSMRVTSMKEGKTILSADIQGKRKALGRGTILSLFLRYPMMPLMAMILIHRQALRLWMKKIDFRNKEKTDDMIVRRLK